MKHNFVILIDFFEIESKILVEALLSYILLLIAIRGGIFWDDEYGLDEAFTVILGDKVDHTPLDPRLPFLAE